MLVEVSLLGIEETYHGCHAPDVGAGPPFGAENNFWGTVLSGLDVVCEVMTDPAGVPEICYFDGYDLHGCHASRGFRRCIFIQ